MRASLNLVELVSLIRKDRCNVLGETCGKLRAQLSLLEIKLKKKYRKCQFDKKALCFSLNYWKSACATIYLLEIDQFCQKSAVSIDLPFYVKFVQKNMHNC